METKKIVKNGKTFSLFEGPMGFQVKCLEHDRCIAMIYAVPEALVVGDKECGSKVYAKIQPKKVDWLGFPDWNKMELCDFEVSTTRGNYSPEEFFNMAVDELTSI